jgi:hypothetical protein
MRDATTKLVPARFLAELVGLDAEDPDNFEKALELIGLGQEA